MHFPTPPLSRAGQAPVPAPGSLPPAAAAAPPARPAAAPAPLSFRSSTGVQAVALILLFALSFTAGAATGGDVAIFEGLQSEVDANVFGPLARVGIALCGLAGLVFMMLGKFLYGFMGVAGGGGLYFTDQIVNSPAFSATLDLLDLVHLTAG